MGVGNTIDDGMAKSCWDFCADAHGADGRTEEGAVCGES